MTLWPSTEWLEKYVEALNDNEDYNESGKGWGVDFNGDWLWKIENVPVDKIDMEKLPEDAKKELEENVVEGTIHVFIQQKDGKCENAETITDPSEVDPGFTLSGDYEQWKALSKGEEDATKLVMSGKMNLDGDMSKVMRWIKMIQVMPKIAAEVPKEIIDEEFAK